MTRYILSPQARADLDSIWDYTAETWGFDQAEKYVRLIQAAIESVAAEPLRGRSCNEIRTGYWKYPAGSHVLFYRLTSGGVDIVRILHQRMDFERHL